MNQEDRPLWDLLGKAERSKASVGFAGAVMARIAAEEQTPVSVIHGSRLWWQWGGAAAAAVVAVLGLIISLQEPSQQDALAQVDDELLLDVAYVSLGSESLQDAVCLLSSQDSVADMSDSEIADLVF